MCARDGCEHMSVSEGGSVSAAERDGGVSAVRVAACAEAAVAARSPIASPLLGFGSYVERKAEERGKSFARQVWETVIVMAIVSAVLLTGAWLNAPVIVRCP